MDIRTYHALPGFPRPCAVRVESVSDPAYRQRGVERIDDSCVFQYTLAGEGIFEYAGRRHRLDAESAFLVHAMDPQMQYYYPEDATHPWEMLWVGLVGSAARAMTEGFTNRYGHVFKLPIQSRIVDQLLSLGHKDDPEPMSLTTTQGSAWVADLFKALEAAASEHHQDNPTIHLVIKAQKIIQEAPDPRRLSVEMVAEATGVSREHLSRLFSQQTGLSMKEYIIRHKMHMASRLLKNSTLNSKEISYRLGYSNQANFTRCFKTFFGTTPTRFKASGAVSLDY